MNSSENRQLAAITFIDIADFSELMHHDEAKAVHLLSLQKDIIYPIISSHNGNILKEMGDGLLISFNSAIQHVPENTKQNRKIHSKRVSDRSIFFCRVSPNHSRIVVREFRLK